MEHRFRFGLLRFEGHRRITIEGRADRTGNGDGKSTILFARLRRQNFAVARDVAHSARREAIQPDGQRHNEVRIAAGYGERKQCARRIIALRVLAADVDPFAVGLPTLLGRLNRQLKGWANYFSQGYPLEAYRDINWHLGTRLVHHLKHQRSQRAYRPPEGVTYSAHLQRLGLEFLKIKPRARASG